MVRILITVCFFIVTCKTTSDSTLQQVPLVGVPIDQNGKPCILKEDEVQLVPQDSTTLDIESERIFASLKTELESLEGKERQMRLKEALRAEIHLSRSKREWFFLPEDSRLIDLLTSEEKAFKVSTHRLVLFARILSPDDLNHLRSQSEETIAQDQRRETSSLKKLLDASVRDEEEIFQTLSLLMLWSPFFGEEKDRVEIWKSFQVLDRRYGYSNSQTPWRKEMVKGLYHFVWSQSPESLPQTVAPDKYKVAACYSSDDRIDGRPAFSPDGRWLAVGSHDSHFYLFDLTIIPVLRNPLKYVTGGGIHSSPAFSPDGNWIAVGSGDDHLYLFDRKKDPELKNPRTGKTGGRIHSSPAFSPDGRWIAVGSDDGHLYLFDTQVDPELEDPKTAKLGRPVYTSPAFSHDGRWIAVASGDKHLYLFDREMDPELKNPTPGPTGGPLNSSPAFSSDDRWIAVGSDDNHLYLFDREMDPELKNPRKGPTDGPVYSSPAFSADDRWIVVGSRDKNLYLFDRMMDKDLRNPKRIPMGGLVDSSPAFSPNGRSIAVGSGDQHFYVFDVATDTDFINPKRTKTNGFVGSSPAFSPDGRWLAVGSHDTRLYLLRGPKTVGKK